MHNGLDSSNAQKKINITEREKIGPQQQVDVAVLFVL